jgi:hypothetical protein
MITLPKQQTILPVTGKQVTVYPLVLRDKLLIAESEILTMSERLNFIAKLAYDKLEKEDESYDYQSFLKDTYEQDLNAIIHGILQVTYRKPYPFPQICPLCGKADVYEVPIEQIIKDLKINQGGQDKFYLDLHEVVDPDTNIKFILKLPTLYDVIESLRFAESNDINFLKESVKADNYTALMYKLLPYLLLPAINAIQLPDNTIIRHTNNADKPKVINTLLNMLETTLMVAFEKLEELRSKYYVEFGFKAICKNPECESYKQKKPVEYDIDLLTTFFPIPVEKLLQ